MTFQSWSVNNKLILYFLPKIYASIPFGCIGKLFSALPVASIIALRIAGAMPIFATSPAPAEGRSLRSIQYDLNFLFIERSFVSTPASRDAW
jgi:hypothetical protein